MKKQVSCPHCGSILTGEAEWLDRPVACPVCRREFPFPADSPAVPFLTAVSPAPRSSRTKWLLIVLTAAVLLLAAAVALLLWRSGFGRALPPAVTVSAADASAEMVTAVKGVPGRLITLSLPGRVTLKLLPVKAGSFSMGSPVSEAGHYKDEAQYRVTLTRDYWLGETEVTQAQWRAVMGNNPSSFKGDNLPVERVSWEDALAFCKKLNKLTRGKRPAGYVYGLPSEAQWEYACRAGTAGDYNVGGISLTDLGWYKDNSGNRTHPVREKRPNAWGFYDMHGNVYEWCADWYGAYNGDAVDSTGPSGGSKRVNRGGGWDCDAVLCRSAYRFNDDPGNRSDTLGFRVALVPGQ